MVRRAMACLAAVLLLLMAGAASADSLRLILPDLQPVAGAMVPVTLRGEYTSTIALETLSFPDAPGYDWVQIARDQWRDEQVEGRRVRVFERRLALFPRQAGTLTLGPVVHHLTVIGDDNRRQPVAVTAPAVSLSVAAFPGEGLPLSARSLTLDDQLSSPPGSLRDGETLVRRVTLTAAGTLPHLLPPRPTLREPWLISFAAPERREMQLTPEGPVTTVVWEWHLRPKTGEPGVLPAVPIAWFDTSTHQMRSTEIPAIPFGYASFNGNRRGSEALPTGQAGLALATVAAGLLAGAGFALAGLSQRRRAEALNRLRRLWPFDPTRVAMALALRRGDLIAARRAAEHHVQRRRSLGLPLTGLETAMLDRALYGPPSAPASVGPGAAAPPLLGDRLSRSRRRG